jgi:hypothetical protein
LEHLLSKVFFFFGYEGLPKSTPSTLLLKRIGSNRGPLFFRRWRALGFTGGFGKNGATEDGFLMVNCGEFVVNRWVLKASYFGVGKCHFLKIYFSGFPVWEWVGEGETVAKLELSITFG